MTRGKTPVGKIEDYGSRLTAFSKRRTSLFKKAYELSVLCDVDVSLIVFSHSGNLRHFSGHKRIEDVLTRFLNGPDTQVAKSVSLSKKESLVDMLQNLKLQEDSAERALRQQQNPIQNGSSVPMEDVDLQMATCMSRLDTLKGVLRLINSEEPITSSCVFDERSWKIMDLYNKVQARKNVLLNSVTSSTSSMLTQSQQLNMDLVHESNPMLEQKELEEEYLGWLNDSPTTFDPNEGVRSVLVPPDLENLPSEAESFENGSIEGAAADVMERTTVHELQQQNTSSPTLARQLELDIAFLEKFSFEELTIFFEGKRWSGSGNSQ